MSKKIDYTKSPALAFISGEQETEQTTAAELPSSQDPSTEQAAPAAPKSAKRGNSHTQSAKVRYDEMPAEEVMKLIEAGKMTPQEIAGYMKTINAGTKNRRVQLVFRPNVYQQAKNKADELHKSFNEFIEMILLDYLNNN